VIVTEVSTQTDKRGDTLHIYKYKFFTSEMVMKMGERETDSSKNDLFHFEDDECPFVLNEKALLVTSNEDEEIPDNIKHVFITGVERGKSGNHTYKYMECESTLTGDDVVNKTGTTTTEDGSLYHLPWTKLSPFHKNCHVPFKIGEEAWLFDNNRFKKVKIVKYEDSGPMSFWFRYRVVNVSDSEEIFNCRCDDYELFKLYETLPKLENEEDGTGEPKAKRAKKSVTFSEKA
jgi:hypothetical protein